MVCFRLLPLLTCVIWLCFVPLAAAQNVVSVRLSDSDKYSRMVIDWGRRVPYDIIKTGAGQTTITFKSNGRIPAGIGRQALRNIKGVTLNTAAPLSLRFMHPTDSRVRDFYTGDRLIIDVFNAPSGARFTPSATRAITKKIAAARPRPVVTPILLNPRRKPSRTSEPALTPTPIEPPAPAPAPPMVEPIADPPTAPITDNAPPTDTEPTLTEPTVETPPEPSPAPEIIPAPAPLSLKGQPQTDTSRITFSLNKATSMGAFTLYDRLWMVHNNPESIVPPKVIGDMADTLNNFQSFVGRGGQIFITPAVVTPDYLIKGKGGGVLWEYLLTDKGYAAPDTRTPLSPQIIEHTVNGTQSASVEFPMTGASGIADVIDPITGVTIKVITAKTAAPFVPQRMEYVDFTVLPSIVGLAIIPKVDDLQILLTGRAVKIFRKNGLHVAGTPPKDIDDETRPAAPPMNAVNAARIFPFNDWAMHDKDALIKRRIDTLAGLNDLPAFQQVEDIKDIAKTYLAHGLGLEALGLLNWAQSISPDISEQPEYKALVGLANQLMYRSEEAYIALSDQALNAYPEVKYWSAAALAEIGNWDLAYDTLPPSTAILKTYPSPVFNRIANVIAEIYLRAGKPQQAKTLLDDMSNNAKTLFPEQRAALAYLRGEYARQMGDLETAKSYWSPLSTGINNLYRAKAGLAMTRFQIDKKDISRKQALDNLERLRYAWRGDDLETQIHYWLGRTYIEDKQYGRALNILRDATAGASTTAVANRITDEMRDVFLDVFINQKLDNITPLEAATLYEQFSELIPDDAAANKVINVLANHLATANLYARATALLRHQFDHRVSGLEAFNTGTRLTALHLLDGKPDIALTVIPKLNALYDALPPEQQTTARKDEITLLHVRALSKNGEHNDALFMMDRMQPSADVNALRADIAWQAGFWDDAADGLGNIIDDRNIKAGQTLSDTNKSLLLQYGVALHLANDRIGLANLRETYGNAMGKTDKADVFEVITRARRTPGLADRETLLSAVSETDLFGSFLETYKNDE